MTEENMDAGFLFSVLYTVGIRALEMEEILHREAPKWIVVFQSLTHKASLSPLTPPAGFKTWVHLT